MAITTKILCSSDDDESEMSQAAETSINDKLYNFVLDAAQKPAGTFFPVVSEYTRKEGDRFPEPSWVIPANATGIAMRSNARLVNAILLRLSATTCANECACNALANPRVAGR